MAPLLSVMSVCIPLSLNAQTYGWSENYGSINLGQGNSAIVSANTQAIANNACAPTAVAMGLDYLYSEDPVSFASNPDGYGTVNQLITAMGTTSAGTTGGGVTTGLGTYSTVDNLAADYFTYSQNTVTSPTAMAATIGNLNTSLQALQLGILWTGTPVSGAVTSGNDGGHFVSVTGVNLTVSGSTVTGTITVLDPWGLGASSAPHNAATSAATQTLTVTTDTLNGGATVLEVTGWTPVGNQPFDQTANDGTGAADYGFAQADYGYIAFDEIESIPEPSTMALLLTPLGAGLLRLLRKNRTA